jgi:predicted RNase H-like nuclease (RuvC/YqgF family)
MPAETYNEEKQIIMLNAKVDNLTKMVELMSTKFDGFSAGFSASQKDYYIEHQKVVSEVREHTKAIEELEKALECLETINSELKVKTQSVDDIKTIKTVLYGNGGIGLVGKIDKIQDWVAGQVWFQRLLIGSVAAQVIALIFLLLKSTSAK